MRKKVLKASKPKGKLGHLLLWFQKSTSKRKRQTDQEEVGTTDTRWPSGVIEGPWATRVGSTNRKLPPDSSGASVIGIATQRALR